MLFIQVYMIDKSIQRVYFAPSIHQPVFVLGLLILIKSVWCLQKSLFSIYWSVLSDVIWTQRTKKIKKLFNLNFKMSMLSMVWKCKVYNHFFIMFGCLKTVWRNTTVEIWNCFHMEMFWDVWFCLRRIHRRLFLQQIVRFKISSLIVHYATYNISISQNTKDTQNFNQQRFIKLQLLSFTRPLTAWETWDEKGIQ